MRRFSHEVGFVIETCFKCGIQFGITQDLYDTLQRLGEDRSFYCPNGHGQIYIESAEQRLKKQLEEEQLCVKLLRESERRALQDAEHFKSQRNGYKGQLARVKKRIANGICPCCNRYFENLHRHMQSKHKDFIEESGLIQAMDARTPEDFDAIVDKVLGSYAPSTQAQYRMAAKAIRAALFQDVEPPK